MNAILFIASNVNKCVSLCMFCYAYALFVKQAIKFICMQSIRAMEWTGE